jgi:pyruvate,water dikinase
MRWWRARTPSAADLEDRLRQKYLACRRLIALNNECLELMAGLQDDLSYVLPRPDGLGDRIGAISSRASAAVGELETLAERSYASLIRLVDGGREEIEREVARREALDTPRLAVGLRDVGLADRPEVGSKAAALGEIANRLGLPVPAGYVVTTAAYWQFFGVPCWQTVRDVMSRMDVDDAAGVREGSARLTDLVMTAPLPRAVEVAITDRAAACQADGAGLAVRSSAVGEGDTRSFAGQFASLLNVPPVALADAYRQVVASRFSERALTYRLTTGLEEVSSAMAVLVLPTLRAAASGILYTRDPRDPRADAVLVTATPGFGPDIASGRIPADFFVVSRGGSHRVLAQRVGRKAEALGLAAGGGLARHAVEGARVDEPALDRAQLATLADHGVRLERHFGRPQDVEWVLDEHGRIWLVQTRPLAVAAGGGGRSRTRQAPLAHGGLTVYPGRTSGPACVTDDVPRTPVPRGSVLFLRRPSPEIVRALSHIEGLVAEAGNVTGHAAALLREFRIPSVFGMDGAAARVKTGEPVSLDAGGAKVYAGTLWAPRALEAGPRERYVDRSGDVISRRLLALNLVDPNAFNFRPSGCRSTHDVLRFCHQKAIEAMFRVSDREVDRGAHAPKRLITPAPVNLYVLDLGGGLAADTGPAADVKPAEVLSRPFQALWRGVTHPGVTWNRQLPPTLDGLASVVAESVAGRTAAERALGDRSYLMVAGEYMNLNTRLAYHFTLVDACLSDAAAENYISFRFAGGGASRRRRNLRGCFVEACLAHYGFQVDRRGDVVNAWCRKAQADDTAEKLDIIGRLMACATQLDMYMTGQEMMRWYVRQFLEGNYAFAPAGDGPPR